MRRLAFLALVLFATTVQGQAIAEKVKGMEKFPGFFTFYWDAKAGKIWLEIDKWNTEFLYVESLPAGIGSNASACVTYVRRPSSTASHPCISSKNVAPMSSCQ